MAEKTNWETLEEMIGKGGTLGANSADYADYGDDEPISRQREQTGADSAD